MDWITQHASWSSGPWSLELRDDELADIAYDGRPVLRAVRAVVRDRNWDTAPLVVDRVRETDATLTLHVRSAGLGSSFRGVVRVEARDARLVVIADLESEHPFETNRTGLVVLHPPALAGADLRVTHPDGREEATAFPESISPHQPVRDISGLAWTHGGLDVRLRFDGDVFEMEDQRNWTDASFKTYSRPLSLPFPYPISAGDRVVQTLEIEVATTDAAPGIPMTDTIALTSGEAFPAIAVAASTAPDPAPAVAPVGSAVLVELDLATRNWRAALGRAAASGLPLDVQFVLADDDALAAGVAALRDHDVVRVTAFQPEGAARHISDAAAIATLRRALAAAGVSAAVVGGARSHFTELNREHHRLPADLDGIVFSVTPLFHSLGTEQLVESLAMQRLVAAQAVRIAASVAGGPSTGSATEGAGTGSGAEGVPVHIGPIGLRPHFNDVATTPPPRAAHDDLRDGYGPALLDLADPRQDAEELAAWTIASAAALAVPGVETLTFFEEWGPRGIRDASGTDRPVADAIRALAALSGTALLHGASPDGLIWAIGGADAEGRERVLVANLDRTGRTLRLTTETGHAGIHLGPLTWLALDLPAPR
ncbi:hypothetical protein [Microbacterium sp. RU33B]|uniref:hypothetical protein n=1 Tax=Microbacterium sp. RU33B TaxID=1907390 RepID=UPI00096719A3|nr:hypothetical protein [Microbacterium sp. RU33B]SIT86913.1 hypothetical protein SAMN05880545_2690 [Microbacterium sp. RU33B]